VAHFCGYLLVCVGCERDRGKQLPFARVKRVELFSEMKKEGIFLFIFMLVICV
jgi:hypothetical protein